MLILLLLVLLRVFLFLLLLFFNAFCNACSSGLCNADDVAWRELISSRSSGAALLAGHGEAAEPAAGPGAGRRAAGAALRRQVLHARSGAARGGVHALPLLHADQGRPGARLAPVQRQDGRPARLLPRPRWSLSLLALHSPVRWLSL